MPKSNPDAVSALTEACHAFNRALLAAGDDDLDAAPRHIARLANNSRYGADLEPWQFMCAAIQAEGKRRAFTNKPEFTADTLCQFPKCMESAHRDGRCKRHTPDESA